MDLSDALDQAVQFKYSGINGLHSLNLNMGNVYCKAKYEYKEILGR